MGLFEAIATAGQWVPAVIAIASAITAVTPTQKDNRALARVVGVLRILGLNVWKAKPADDAPPKQPERRRGGPRR